MNNQFPHRMRGVIEMLNSKTIGIEIPVKIRYRQLSIPDSSGFDEGYVLVVTMNAITTTSLALYTKDQWNKIVDQFDDASKDGSDGFLALKRFLIGNAAECIVKDGKIGIPPTLMSQAWLHREAIWIQRENQVEIRSAELKE